nr:ATP-binding protein [Rhodococcus opacus]
MTTPPAPEGPVDPIGADLIAILKTLKLGALKDTLPERLVLARQHRLSHVAFLELLLTDEMSRRESRSAKARLDQSMRIDTWNALDDLRYDRGLLSDLVSLRFAEAGHSVLVLGPVGVGKTHLATALGHVAIRRRMTVLCARADKLFARLRAARLDNSVEAEVRRIATVYLLVLDLSRHGYRISGYAKIDRAVLRTVAQPWPGTRR